MVECKECTETWKFDNIAEAFMVDYPAKAFNDDLYLYEEKKGYFGYFRQSDIKKLMSELHNYCKSLNSSGQKTARITEMLIKQIISYTMLDAHVNESSIDPNYIAVDNGILDISVYPPLLIGPSPDFFTPIRIPVKYDPTIKFPPRIDAFLRDITIDKSGFLRPDDRDVLTLYEMAGYVLEPGYFIHRGVLLVGLTHNGKSTYYNILSRFLGSDNIARLSLYDIDKFAGINVISKLVNIMADLGSYGKLSDKSREKYKAFVGEEEGIDTHVKHAPKQILFKNRAKFYFGCNTDFTGKGLPGLSKKAIDDVAFKGRWVIILLPNTYPDKRGFIDSLVTPEELSGFLNKALEGLDRLRKQNKFSKSITQDNNELQKWWESARIVDARLVDKEDTTEVPEPDFDASNILKLHNYPELTSGYWAISKVRIHVPKSILDQPKKITKDKPKK